MGNSTRKWCYKWWWNAQITEDKPVEAGGASDIRIGGTSLGDRVMIAGGGGGAVLVTGQVVPVVMVVKMAVMEVMVVIPVVVRWWYSKCRWCRWYRRLCNGQPGTLGIGAAGGDGWAGAVAVQVVITGWPAALSK